MIKSILKKINGYFNKRAKETTFSKSQKIFCIGANKTGTTSVSLLFNKLGLIVGLQRDAELLLTECEAHNYENLFKYIKYKGVAFQDIPINLPKLFTVLDKEFTDSKFILTIRDTPEAWYKSISMFHAIVFGNGVIPTKTDLQNAEYVYKGWIWQWHNLVFKTAEDDIYNETALKNFYINYNASVIEYFKDKPGKLLVINVKEPNAALKISEFLNTGTIIDQMPWENKT